MTIDKARRLQRMARWHRRFAVFIAVWMLFLAISGVLINHAHDWGLDSTPLPRAVQHGVYGIDRPAADHCGEAVIEGIDCNAVFARLSLPAGALLLTENHLFLLDEVGQLVERLAVGQLGLERLDAVLDEGPRIYLKGSGKTVTTDPDLLEIERLGTAQSAALDDREWLIHTGREAAITWERLVLDLHAARFLGPMATWFSDLMAALIIVLGLSGMWLFRLRRNANGNGSAAPRP